MYATHFVCNGRGSKSAGIEEDWRARDSPATSVLVGGNGGVRSPATTPRAKSEIRSAAGKHMQSVQGTEQGRIRTNQAKKKGKKRRPIECVALVSSAATQLALIACDKRQQQAQDTNANDDGTRARAAGLKRKPRGQPGR